MKLSTKLIIAAGILGIAFSAFGQEVITQYSNNTLPTLNEELRKARATLSSLQDNVNTNAFPSGGIVMWSGTIATIPSGWALCDGDNGTPDLRNRFIVGADADSGGVAKSTVTGSALQTSDGVIPAHTHTIDSRDQDGSDGWKPFVTSTAGTAHTETTSSYGTGTKNIATFYALAFIMKL